MGNRVATQTILGYFYQFDYSIRRLLELRHADDTITVEGIEDLDINSADEVTAIQCKYYAKTEYNHSVIAKPVRLMLNHFAELKQNGKPKVNYYLYGHFKSGQCKLTLPITVDFMKMNFLTYSEKKVQHLHHKELGLDDNDLKEFVNLLNVDIAAIDYDSQLKNIMDLFKRQFECGQFEAEHFYYNNALQVIKSIAVNEEIGQRKIEKQEFLRRIDTKRILFNNWFVAYKGKEQFLKELRKNYFSTLNASPFERIFAIEGDKVNYVRSSIKEVIYLISEKWSNLSKRAAQPFCPYVYIHGINQQELLSIKKELHSEGLSLIDGYDFYGSPFSADSICKQANWSNGIKLKFFNTREELYTTINYIKKTKEVYQFYIHEPYLTFSSSSFKHVKIQLSNLTDIKGVI